MFQTSALHQSEWRNFWLCVCLYLENINTHRTHNSSIHSDVGLTFKTSALKLVTVANVCYQLS